MIESIIRSGLAADIMLAFMVVEGVFLIGLGIVRKRFSNIFVPLAGLLAGAFIVLALRAALMGGDWSAIATFIALSLFAHLAEIGLRMRRQDANPTL